MASGGSSQAKKGLPKRCMSAGLKERRARSWRRGQVRKQQRIEAQRKREQANAKVRAEGRFTPHEINELARQHRRAGAAMQPRTDTGNIITGTDPKGIVTVKPCCQAKHPVYMAGPRRGDRKCFHLPVDGYSVSYGQVQAFRR